MDTRTARSKWEALQRMTVERGCSIHEAATAKRLADALAKKYGFADTPPTERWRPDFDTRYARAEKKAAARAGWEYRTCGKDRCRCMRGGAPHGPYRYAKRREGKTVRSIYMGR